MSRQKTDKHCAGSWKWFLARKCGSKGEFTTETRRHREEEFDWIYSDALRIGINSINYLSLEKRREPFVMIEDMKLPKCRIGLLINFNVTTLKKGLKRMVLCTFSSCSIIKTVLSNLRLAPRQSQVWQKLLLFSSPCFRASVVNFSLSARGNNMVTDNTRDLEAYKAYKANGLLNGFSINDPQILRRSQHWRNYQ